MLSDNLATNIWSTLMRGAHASASIQQYLLMHSIQIVWKCPRMMCLWYRLPHTPKQVGSYLVYDDTLQRYERVSISTMYKISILHACLARHWWLLTVACLKSYPQLSTLTPKLCNYACMPTIFYIQLVAPKQCRVYNYCWLNRTYKQARLEARNSFGNQNKCLHFVIIQSLTRTSHRIHECFPQLRVRSLFPHVIPAVFIHRYHCSSVSCEGLLVHLVVANHSQSFILRDAQLRTSIHPVNTQGRV